MTTGRIAGTDTNPQGGGTEHEAKYPRRRSGMAQTTGPGRGSEARDKAEEEADRTSDRRSNPERRSTDGGRGLGEWLDVMRRGTRAQVEKP